MGDLLDPAALETVRRVGGEKLIRKVVGIFLEASPKRMGAAREGEKAGDLEAVRQAVHALRSSSVQLGLSAVSRLAGEIEDLAEEGKGERIPELLGKLEAVLERSRELIAGFAETKKKLVVVEDNAENRLIFQALLQDRYKLVAYEDGPSALEGMSKSKPDLVLMDFSLPGMDGAEVLRRMREDPALRDVPVLVATAHREVERFLAHGFDGYVAKPILDEAAFLAEIERRLGRH